MLLGCGPTAEAAGLSGEKDPAEQEEQGQRIEIKALNGSIVIPDDYYAFSEDIPYTDEMLLDIGIKPENFQSALPLLMGNTMIVPAGEPYTEDTQTIYLKVKGKSYDNITLSELTEAEYQLIAQTVVASFGVLKYETVEGSGLRFFVFNADQGMGNVCRFATILNGHMIYLYTNTGKEEISEEQLALMTDMALSIEHDLD